ncbi:MAG: hypothetical protein NXH75_10005 [Halobacteriovoraceae bacterium]|nr:hypothetical protein [Halobacteriovoraceae bacterium]
MKTLLITLTTLLSLVSINASEVSQREEAKAQLVKSYNAFSKMNDAQYSKSLRSLSSAAAKAGLVEEAKLFNTLSNDPASRIEILDQMKGQIEQSSENGIYFIVYLMYPQTWCFVGDLRCGFGVGLLSLLTLEGEEASDF